MYASQRHESMESGAGIKMNKRAECQPSPKIQITKTFQYLW
ncbi:11433_t:CDS:2 [Funneliformis caledonium]|uniref:11433_t:CDS:1 n=1 Tax=Funneliformis caledonium TaxID=1117310 RepID=A0A9N9A0I8_9GLOM|nr:11433_t:CDS:2 [Funneliformis caledonium]